MGPRTGHAALLAMLMLATACAAPGSSQTPTRDPAGQKATSPTPPTATPPTATPGRVTTIPDGVRLRHEDEWRALDRPGRSPLQDVCLDPGQGGLYLPGPTDYRGVTTGEDTEELGVYRAPGRAGDAIGLWRVQAQRCGGAGTNDHVGRPMEWVVHEVRIDGADEAWQAHLLMTVEGPDLGTVGSFLTVARVGNAVYVEVDGDRFSPEILAEKGRSGLASVAAYVPTLAPFAEAT